SSAQKKSDKKYRPASRMPLSENEGGNGGRYVAPGTTLRRFHGSEEGVRNAQDEFTVRLSSVVLRGPDVPFLRASRRAYAPRRHAGLRLRRSAETRERRRGCR